MVNIATMTPRAFSCAAALLQDEPGTSMTTAGKNSLIVGALRLDAVLGNSAAAPVERLRSALERGGLYGFRPFSVLPAGPTGPDVSI